MVYLFIGNPSQSYGASPATWDHTVLLATQHRWMHPAITPASQPSTRFMYCGWCKEMKGRVDLEGTFCSNNTSQHYVRSLTVMPFNVTYSTLALVLPMSIQYCLQCNNVSITHHGSHAWTEKPILRPTGSATVLTKQLVELGMEGPFIIPLAMSLKWDNYQ